jgi:hypothetical protein
MQSHCTCAASRALSPANVSNTFRHTATLDPSFTGFLSFFLAESGFRDCSFPVSE